MIFNIKNFKLAKTYSKDLEEILKVLDQQIYMLAPYHRYKPVQAVLRAMKDNKQKLQAYYETAKKIVATKGAVPGGETK